MDQYLLLYIGLAALGIFLTVVLTRWVLRIDTLVKNQQAQIALLIKLCKRQGVTEEEIKEVKSRFL